MGNIEEHTAAHNLALAKAEYRLYTPEILQDLIDPSATERRETDSEASQSLREHYDSLRQNNRHYV